MKIRDCTTSYAFVNFAIATLILIGPVFIAVDLSYDNEWIRSFRMGDFYTYITFIGVISIWSIYGLICTLLSSSRGLMIYTIGLASVTLVTFLIGFVHVIVLYTTYQPILMNTCLQRDSSRYFWWALGHNEPKEMKEIYSKCSSICTDFSNERMISWIVYSIISFICLQFIITYYRKLNEQHEFEEGIIIQSTQDVYQNEKNIITYHNEDFPVDDSQNMSSEMYQQRQKLYEEIMKRQKAKNTIKTRRESIRNTNKRNSILAVHPLDLSNKPESYQPPPSLPEYNSIEQDQLELERNKKLKSLSSERMEYELYCTNPNIQSQSQPQIEPEKNEGVGYSQRKRPSSGRWSSIYPGNSSDVANTTEQEVYREEAVAPTEVVKEETTDDANEEISYEKKEDSNQQNVQEIEDKQDTNQY